MKTRSLLMGLALGMASVLNSNADLNLLSDPGFESGTPVPSAAGGWATPIATTFSQTYHRSGAWSMENYYDPTDFDAISAQKVAAAPGIDYLLTGWVLTPQTLSSSSTLGYLIIFFTDANGATIGQYLPSAPLDNTAPKNTWVQLSVESVAPASTVSVYAETMLWNPGVGDALYFDDLSLTVVPEPSAWAVLSAGLGLAFLGRRRMRLVGS